MTGSGGLSGVDVSNDDNVNMWLFFSHGYGGEFEVRIESKMNLQKKYKTEWVKRSMTRTAALQNRNYEHAGGSWTFNMADYSYNVAGATYG